MIAAYPQTKPRNIVTSFRRYFEKTPKKQIKRKLTSHLQPDTDTKSKTVSQAKKPKHLQPLKRGESESLTVKTCSSIDRVQLPHHNV